MIEATRAGRTGGAGVPLQMVLLALVAAASLAGMLPAGVILDRWVARELELRVRADLELAPRMLADRNAAVGDAMMMHARDVAHAQGLGEAVMAGEPDLAVRIADNVARSFNSLPVIVDRDGRTWTGPAPPGALVEATRSGEMPVAVVGQGDSLYLLSVAAVEAEGVWAGAGGVATPLDEAAAAGLAGLARADLVVVLGEGGARAISAADDTRAAEIVQAVSGVDPAAGVSEIMAGGSRFLLTATPMAGATVVFARDLSRELAILGRLRGALAAAGAGALGLALLLGAVLARGIVRPARTLATAAGRLSQGDFGAPLASSAVREVSRVTEAFSEMRSALAVRIDELRAANHMLEERQDRLTALQSELIHRERVAASGRIAAELAHEIRNPVANLRNCLELLHRRLQGDPEGREYATLAIDELLRMHELAERMLHLNRPRDPAVTSCDAGEVAGEVAAISRIGAAPGEMNVSLRVADSAVTAVPPDALKQILLNLVQNAREAAPAGLELEIEVARSGAIVVVSVRDNGPGVPPAIRERIFDPFFTTRETAGGVGLGLFVVEGMVRAFGGTVTVEDAPTRGACFRVSLPALKVAAADLPAPTMTAVVS